MKEPPPSTEVDQRAVRILPRGCYARDIDAILVRMTDDIK
jgi:hypothetical protein